MTTADRGSVSLWILGLSILLMLFGGLMIDFWRGLALQRELSAVADSAAIAAASGIDEETYRTDGILVLDLGRVRTLAAESIAFQEVELSGSSVALSADATMVSVEVEGLVKLGLLGVFIPDDRPLVVRATASATPALIP